MDILTRYGMTIEEIQNMIDSNREINNIDENDISRIIESLQNIGCSKKQIKNILISNPYLLSIKLEEIEKTINKLLELGMNHIELLLDKNPYILNYNYKEIDSMERYQKKCGLTEEEIKNLIYEKSEEWI